MKTEAATCKLAPTGNCIDAIEHSLMRAEAYAERPARITHAETHISHVFLTDRRAYKIKKPVQFPFLDYSTVELRLRACQDELRLNRRLAPRVYLAVRPITVNSAGQVEIDGAGAVLDYCVEMERLPAERMLDRMIHDRVATREHIDRLLDMLVPFYAASQRGAEIAEHATAAAVEANVKQNLTMIDQPEQGWPRAMLQRVHCAQLQFVKANCDLFAERIRAGYVCEGHGDLRPEHVCMLPDLPVVFDCVEFSLPLRAADIISELAFLAMEFDFLGAPDLGTALMLGYQRRTGDDVPANLIDFYKSYRACVRAKVELLRAAQESRDMAMQGRSKARRYLQLASSYGARFYRPKMFVMAGAAGTGKSTIATALAEALGLEILRTDVIRHELAGRREPDAELGKGIYSDSMNRSTYGILFDRAANLLRESVSLVLDGTFCESPNRLQAAKLANQLGADVHFVRCRCSAELAHARIANRIQKGGTLSDARPELYDIQQKKLDSSDDWQTLPVINVDTSQPTSTIVESILGAMDSSCSVARPRSCG